ncbi:hypothetical protein HYDPIDRAFT_121614 [Hydnomerulius pinastri MD-312]|nr:hypothetical protein HYDPIDRAFT_121614 [Hydnomerulius pinastri MD-312]
MVMEAPHPLQTLLHFHLASDASAVAHASYVLDHLSPPCFSPSPHLQKWVTRITSLMHSKDPGARWAAICFAYRTSALSSSLLMEQAQSWVGLVLPLLSKPESIPTLKASMRYLRLVLGAALGHPEFQRQVAVPAVPKASLALVSIAEKHSDQAIKTLAIQTLAQLVPIYPSLHKALSSRLFALCHHIFNGSAFQTTDGPLLSAAARLHATLHSLGGKVGGANLWRNSLDAVLQSSWSALSALRTTFPTSAAQFSQHAFGYTQPGNDDVETISGNPLTTVALNLDRLTCGVTAICALLRTPVQRPVQVPIGPLVAFCWSLMACTADEPGQPHFDPYVRAAEAAAVPQIWTQACNLLSCLAQTTQHLLAPHVSRLIMILACQLEKNLEPPQRLAFLRCADHVLHFCPTTGTQLGVTRLIKATISSMTSLYFNQSDPAPSSGGVTSQSKANRKRQRDYQADNVLSTSKAAACTTADERSIVLAALDVLDEGLQSVELSSATRSLANRVLLSVLLSLPSTPASSLSSDRTFHGKVLARVREICCESAQGPSNAMSKSTGLVFWACTSEGRHRGSKAYTNLDYHIDLLLHPRRPPYVRSLPDVESLSLTFAEESVEETAARRLLGSMPGHEPHGEAVTQEYEQTTAEPLSAQPHVQAPPATVPLPQQPQVSTLFSAVPPPSESRSDADVARSTKPTPASFTTPPQTLFPPAPVVVVEPSPPPRSPKAPRAPVTHVAPMVVDEVENDDMPAIDMDSDSDG